MMIFNTPLIHGYLIKRYKRFLADILLDSGETVVAHCTNSGSMKSCLETGAEVYLSPTTNPNRKTQFTWEMIKIDGNWVGINTNNPNLLAYEFIKNKPPKILGQYDSVRREVVFGESRFDIVAENTKETCIIEVKNVTYKSNEFALFPDSVTTRGLKHLKHLQELKSKGYRCVMLYIIQRMDVEVFSPAREIDPEYAKHLKIASKNGVEIIPIRVKVSPESIEYDKQLRFEL